MILKNLYLIQKKIIIFMKLAISCQILKKIKQLKITFLNYEKDNIFENTDFPKYYNYFDESNYLNNNRDNNLFNYDKFAYNTYL